MLLNLKTRKVGFAQFIYIFLASQLVFGASFFILPNKPVRATVTQNNTTGTYTDDFASNSGMPTRSYVNVNTDTGKLQLTHDDSQTAFTAPYATSGYAYTSVITPLPIAKWNTITFTTTTPANTTLKVQILDDGNDAFSDTYIPGNSTGIAAATIDISNIPVLACALQTAASKCNKPYTIKIKFLMTSDSTATPTIDDLSVTWTPTQGTLTASGPSTAAWPTANVDQKGTLHSPYANSSTYPAFKWASDKYIGSYAVDRLWTLEDKIFGYTSIYYGYMFALDRDVGTELWKIPFIRSSGPEGTISSNGTFYGTDKGNDAFYVVDTDTGQVKWAYNFTAGGHGNDHTVITSDGTIYTIRYPANSGTATIYAFNPDSSINWQEDYVISLTATDMISSSQFAVGADETLYIYLASLDVAGNSNNDGKLYAIDSADGSVNWTYVTGDLEIFPPVIDSEGTIYVVKPAPTPTDFIQGVGWDYVSYNKEIYAIKSDGTLKWKKGLGTEVGGGYKSLSLRSDSKLLTLRADSNSGDDPYNLSAISINDGSLVWSKGVEAINISFTDGNNGVAYTDTIDGIGYDYYTRINYLDSSSNSKWSIVYPYDTADGANTIYYYLDPVVQDERGWLYGSFAKRYYTAGSVQVTDEEFAQSFAMQPWTLTNSSNISGIKVGGDTLNFSVTTSMLQTNPLLGGNNQVQVVMDNGDKVPLSYSSTDGSGNTVWTGSYTLPKNTTACGTHSYTVEASQSYLQTDITTHFDTASTESNNTGLTASGTFSSLACGGGIPAEGYNPPTLPSNGNFQVSINNNDKITNNRIVILNLIGGPNTTKMSLSNTSDFTNATQEDYQTTKQWDLCSRSGGALKDNFCPAGEKTVYAKFFTKYGVASSVVFDTINYQPGVANANTLNTFSAVIASNTTPFLKDLKLGQTNFDVKRLQIFLNSDPATQISKTGPGSPGKETSFFGSLTKLAVIKFQEKYAQDILTPLGLKKGTGFFSKNTRGKANSIIGVYK